MIAGSRWVVAVVVAATAGVACGVQEPAPGNSRVLDPTPEALRPQEPAPEGTRMQGPVNYWTGHPAVNEDGSVNVVVEIPAGTNAKWEVTEDGSALEWERVEEGLRVVRYLPYPANYGMIPSTVQDAATGGDGDPLDVLVLGSAAERGSVVRVRLVGVLRLLDDGERDDKLLAVPLEGSLSDVGDLDELRSRHPGITTIVETWFSHYKGPARIESRGYADAAAAREILEEAVAAFVSGTRGGTR